MRPVATMLLLLLAIELSPTATADQYPPQERRCEGHGSEIGGVLGTIGGAVIGNKFGRGTGRVFATILGGAIGGWIGSEIGRELDCQSQERAANATSDALQTGSNQSWNNNEAGTSGQVEVHQPDPQVAAAHPGQECRTVVQTVQLSDGRVETYNVQACRNGDGSWSPV